MLLLIFYRVLMYNTFEGCKATEIIQPLPYTLTDSAPNGLQ